MLRYPLLEINDSKKMCEICLSSILSCITSELFTIDYMSTKLEQAHISRSTMETIIDSLSILRNSVSVMIKVSKYLSGLCAPPPFKSSTNQLTSTS